MLFVTAVYVCMFNLFADDIKWSTYLVQNKELQPPRSYISLGANDMLCHLKTKNTLLQGDGFRARKQWGGWETA